MEADIDTPKLVTFMEKTAQLEIKIDRAMRLQQRQISNAMTAVEKLQNTLSELERRVQDSQGRMRQDLASANGTGCDVKSLDGRPAISRNGPMVVDYARMRSDKNTVPAHGLGLWNGLA
uniref:Uncharacterized protein n=1 Tax=Acrobeloides nanus TaxID=290746 RepID=A0A914DQ03_9BILA